MGGSAVAVVVWRVEDMTCRRRGFRARLPEVQGPDGKLGYFVDGVRFEFHSAVSPPQTRQDRRPDKNP